MNGNKTYENSCNYLAIAMKKAFKTNNYAQSELYGQMANRSLKRAASEVGAIYV